MLILRKKTLLFLFFLLSVSLFAQQKEIKGTVTDALGEPLMGVSVYVKGNAKIGTATNFDGEFALKVPESTKKLVASYIGMKATEFDAAKGEINVVMQEDSSVLDEVVVIGYQAVKRKDLTGSVSSVQGNTLKDIPVTNVTQALQGKLSGVQITTTEGSPDADIKIRVRGGGSITQDSAPLYIVDGFPVSSISDIPASEIASIDVLKDASSTAIYGSRGANGVVIVTTKSGQEGKFTVNYGFYAGIKKIAKTLDVLSTEDYLNWQYELVQLRNSGKTEDYNKYFGSYEDISLYEGIDSNDWQDLVFGRTGHMINHNLSFTGGSDKFSYSFNYAHIYDKAIMVGSDYKRDNISLKLKHKPFSNLTIDYSFRYSDTKVNGGGMNEQNEKSSSDSRMKHSVIFSPIPFEGTDDGEDEFTSSDLVNPFKAIADTEKNNTTKRYTMAASVTWKPIKMLTLKSDLNTDYSTKEENRFYGTSTYFVRNNAPAGTTNLPAMEYYNNKVTTFGITNTAMFDFKDIFGKKSKHSANVLAGQEYFVDKTTKFYSSIFGFPSSWDASTTFNHTAKGTPYSVDNNMWAYDKLISFFGRANYDFDSKYIAAVTFRADGSSKFARGNRWGYFPSVALAWRMSSEPFMESTKAWLNDLKLRASYGAAGNNNIPSGQTERLYSSSETAWVEGVNNYWSTSKILYNPDLKWETTYTKNLGFDFTVLDSRLTASVEFYLNNTKDLLNKTNISGSGYDYQYQNVAETENKGVDLSLTYYAVTSKDFDLNFNFNISKNKGKIKKLGTGNYTESSKWTSDITDDFLIAEGGNIGQMYGYKVAGRYEVSDFERYDEVNNKWILKEGVYDSSSLVSNKTVRPGDMKLVDGEKHVIGDANPKHTGGFTLNSRYKNFDLSAVFSWSYGNDIYNANKIQFTSTGKYNYRNMTTEMASGSRWTNMLADGTITNDATLLAELNANTTMWSPFTKTMLFTDWAVEDGSFLRLNTLTLGYTVPAVLLQKFHVTNLRFYASAYNVFCWTNYSGYDPEVSTRRNTPLTPGVDYSAYPKSRQFMLGANITF